MHLGLFIRLIYSQFIVNGSKLIWKNLKILYRKKKILRSYFCIISATLIINYTNLQGAFILFKLIFLPWYVRMSLLQVFIAKCELIENRNTLVVINQFLGKAWFGQLEIVHFPPFFLALNLGLIFFDVAMIFK